MSKLYYVHVFSVHYTTIRHLKVMRQLRAFARRAQHTQDMV